MYAEGSINQRVCAFEMGVSLERYQKLPKFVRSQFERLYRERKNATDRLIQLEEGQPSPIRYERLLSAAERLEGLQGDPIFKEVPIPSEFVRVWPYHPERTAPEFHSLPAYLEVAARDGYIEVYGSHSLLIAPTGNSKCLISLKRHGEDAR